jgi:hypothetical protein
MKSEQIVMPALVAGIHVFGAGQTKTWMAGTSPAMTNYRDNLDTLGALWMSTFADVLYLPTPADVAKW